MHYLIANVCNAVIGATLLFATEGCYELLLAVRRFSEIRNLDEILLMLLNLLNHRVSCASCWIFTVCGALFAVRTAIHVPRLSWQR